MILDPNESRVAISDDRFDWLVNHYQPASKVPAFLNVVDIAGLVKGTLNVWLTQISLQVPLKGKDQEMRSYLMLVLANLYSILFEVFYCNFTIVKSLGFESEDVTHVEGDVSCGFRALRIQVNPTRDLEIINQELVLKDLSYLESALDKVDKLCVRGGDKSKKPELETLLKVKHLLEEKKFVRQHGNICY